MGIFDGIAGALEQQAAGAIAAKMGIDPSLAQSAIGALVQNHSQPGNTVDQAAQQTGISPDILGQIMNQVGGVGGLGALAGALTGAGGPVQDPSAPQAEAPAGGGLGGILAGLGGLSGVASMLDRDGDGNPLNDIAGMLGKQ
ncbi:MAG: hypothetical protein KGL44_13410 [Sphingomonadales bacterium]|nr:hypothetical protein [Sphingomonadales bacterium]